MPNQSWSRDSIKHQILSLYSAGEDLRHGAVAANHQRLVSAAIRYFGSWGSAVTSAGIDYQKILQSSLSARAAKVTRWSRESIVAAIKKMAHDGSPLSASAVRDKHPALFSAAVSSRYYGSWRNAVTAAGFDYDAILAESRTSAVPSETRGMRTVLCRIRVIGRTARELSEDQARARYPRLCERAALLFGSWHSAVDAAFEQASPR